MRVRPCLAFAAVTLALACSDVTVPPRIFVSKVPSGVHTAREDGDPLKLTRWEFDARSGLTRGYWIVRSEHEWRALWPNIDSERIPLLPHGIDFATEMLIVAAPPELAATGARIHQVIDTPEGGVHVYLSQDLPGPGCPAATKDERVPVDMARVKLVDKEIHFHVETRSEDPCSPPSEAKIGCRVAGTADEYRDKLSVDAGKTVTCLSQGKAGSRPTVNRTWSFRSLPPGTTAKMTISQGGTGITFGTDALGTYAIGLEVTDDLGRTSKATTDVDVAPTKDALVVQMLWTKFQPTDDVTTFPRVELHVVGDKSPLPTLPARLLPPMASRSQPWILVRGDCTVETDKPPSWCRARVVAPTSIVEVATDVFPQYRIGVHYTDDRYAGQPVLCVRTFRGALASEWCDDKVRSEGNWWDVAHVDAQTGKTPVPPPAPPASAAASAPAAPPASASAPPAHSAAPAASAAPAGSGKAAPAPKAPPATPKASGAAEPWVP